MSRNLLLLVLVALVGIPLGASYLFGGKAEQIHQGFAKQLSVQGGSTLKESDFSRGVLKSSARDVVEVCSVASGCRELVVNSVVHHGPIAITGLMDGVAPMRPVQAVMISSLRLEGLFAEAKLKPALPDLNISTVVEMDGSSRAVLDMPPSNHKAEGKSGQIVVALGGMSGEFNGIAGSGKVTGNVRYPSFKWQGASGFALDLNNLTVDVDGEVGDTGFIGKLNEKIAGLTITTHQQDPQPLVFRGISITTKASRSSDGLAQTQFSGGMSSISAMGREYGPAQLEGEILRFNRPAMTRMQKELEKLEAQKKPPEEMLPAMMAIYQKGIPEALGSRPELNFKSLSLKTPEGELLANLKLVGVPPQGELNMAAWLTMLQAEFNLQVPAVTLWNILDAQMQQEAQQLAVQSGQAPVMPSQDAIGAKVSELVKANVFVPKLDASAYTMNLAFLEGRLLLNGQENQGFADLSKFLSGQQPAPPAGMEVAPPSP
jgi:uncharacterized protein YdgA (DUF945 family)